MRGSIALLTAALVFNPGIAKTAGFEFGLGVSQPALHDILQPWAVGTSVSLAYVHPVAPRWKLLVGGRYTRYLNDTTSTSSVRVVIPNRLADIGWRLLDIDLGAQYQLSSDRATVPYVRLLLSNSFWRVFKVADGRTLSATDGSGNATDFSSQEVLIRSAAGLHHRFSEQIGLAVEAEVTYLTGIGADFSTSRSRAEGAILLKGTYSWRSGGKVYKTRHDRSAITRPYVPVATPSTPADADGDGVPNVLDRCPGTSPAAAGWVDAYGCPVDSDRDGVPDYLDRCRETPPGAPVGEDGCVADSDGDGVSDLLDQCPDTPPNVRVDAVGCSRAPLFSRTLVFRFNYAPGEAGLDAEARSQLVALVPTLKQNQDLRVAIEGFTDNRGSADANLVLAQKRAEEVKAFLVSQGVSPGQLEAVGRGEVDFVSPNDTPEGRAQNRRIEIKPIR